MRNLGLIIEFLCSLPVTLIRLAVFLVCAFPLVLVGFELPRRRNQENEDRPPEGAEGGLTDDDNDPNRRVWKADLPDHENLERMQQALAAHAWTPSIPKEQWQAERKIRRRK